MAATATQPQLNKNLFYRSQLKVVYSWLLHQWPQMKGAFQQLTGSALMTGEQDVCRSLDTGDIVAADTKVHQQQIYIIFIIFGEIILCMWLCVHFCLCWIWKGTMQPALYLLFWRNIYRVYTVYLIHYTCTCCTCLSFFLVHQDKS